MSFYDYREPIEYVVDRYFEKKRFLYSNSANSVNSSVFLRRGEVPDTTLPEIPCRIIRDASGKASKFIYGNLALLSSGGEGDPVVWQEELIRNTSGLLTHIVTTYPNGDSVTTELVRNNAKVTDYKY